MRARSIVQIVSFAVIVAAGALWLKSRVTAVDLQARLAALTDDRATSLLLEQKRDGLRSALAEAGQRQKAEVSATLPSPVIRTVPDIPRPVLSLGEWRASREWRNEGRSTARGTVGTLLWAAAGGDVATMMQIIAFDEAGRKEAQAFFDALPPAARLAFSTPEALVTSMTIQAVPDAAAQLSWFHQRDADHATVGLLLGSPGPTVPTEVRVDAAHENDPPALVDDRPNKLTVLSLQRSSSGWRVIIPAAAIKRLAQLPTPPKS